MYRPLSPYFHTLQEAQEAGTKQATYFTRPDPEYEAMIAAEKRAELSPPGSREEEPWEEQWSQMEQDERGYYHDGRYWG
jgi:hypothetical protein